jgi:hypothetical protein
MPVLILALASVVVFVGTLVLIAFANMAEEHQLRQLDLNTPGLPFRVLSVCDAFEPEYAVLWDTQAPALRLIAAEGNRGLPLNRLRSVYRTAARCYPELYDGCTFQQWLSFLELAELVTTTEHRATITKEGVEFLKYRVPTQAAA